MENFNQRVSERVRAELNKLESIEDMQPLKSRNEIEYDLINKKGRENEKRIGKH